MTRLAESEPTLPDLLVRAASRFPGRGIALAAGRRGAFERRGYGRIHDDACRMAGRLRSLGVRPGEPLLVALPTSWSWLDSWFGALLVGALPTAVAPLRALRATEDQVRSIGDLADQLRAQAVISNETLRTSAVAFGQDRLAGRVLSVERLAETPSTSHAERRRPDPEGVAYLQLTSGSTGRPRAVMVSHANVVHNVAAMDEIVGQVRRAPAHTWADRWVSWVPLFHDMGLVGCVLNPMACGLDAWLLDPSSFLSRPRLWLEALGGAGTTLTSAPNQGYAWAAERLSAEERRALSLASCGAAVNGAEMVRTETADAFAAAFASSGFDARVLRPSYGLAEATLAVTMDGRGEGVRSTKAPASAPALLERATCVGGPIRDTDLRIVAPNGGPVGESGVGEIEVRGPGVSRGYYDDPDASRAAKDGDWLRTGDLGFLAGGELYVTGRIKEILILRGENVMPEELERPADRVAGAGRSAAFSVQRAGRSEEAILVVEADAQDRERLESLEREIRRALGRALTLPLADVVLVRRGAIPRTTSGKPQRGRLREQYLSGVLGRLR